VSASAGVNILVLDNDTIASISGSSTVSAGGDVGVFANDSTDVDGVAGASGSARSASAPRCWSCLTKDTQAFIGNSATVDAKGAGVGLAGVFTGDIGGSSFGAAEAHGVIVQANSSEEFLHLAVAAGAGYVGVAGGIAISLLDSDTDAYIGTNANINQNNIGADSDQSVSSTPPTRPIRSPSPARWAWGFVGGWRHRRRQHQE
jgi:hypothetical protein